MLSVSSTWWTDMTAGVPTIDWAPSAGDRPPDEVERTAARRFGGAAGLGVALVCVGLQVPALSGAGLERDDGSVEGLVIDALPSLIAGTAAGWAMGPSAARARGAGGWLGVILGLTLLTLVAGALTTALVLVLPTAAGGPVPDLLAAPVQVAILVVLGLLFLGPVVLPVLLVPAAVWAIVMRVSLSPVRGSRR